MSGADLGGQPPAPPPDDAGGAACATVSVGVELLPVHLAFAFDVSGSMGKGDEDWHDKSLKWDPVVLATRSFFENSASQGLFASLTFFPAADDRCAAEMYLEPDVPMTALPSPSFAAALAAIEPSSSDGWRGGTPTAAVMRGTREFAASERESEPGRYALVLVTDGYPSGCDDEEDSIEAVVAEVELAQELGVSTYVIGVANPPLPDAPDTVSDLHEIALAGGTEQAFLIDTGDPGATASALEAAIARIRAASVSCDVAIPAQPSGAAFDKERVAVRYRGQDHETSFHYDASCAGAQAWRYDDPAAPTRIELCPATCSQVQAAPEAMLDVQFTCQSVIVL